MKVIAMRHGISSGNEQRVIQGQLGSYELTEEGSRAIRTVAIENKQLLSNIKRVFTSDSRRALQTAENVVEALVMDIPIIKEDLLREVNTGALSGLTHDEAALEFPDFYGIWIERGDLDGIDGAESGNQLQARSIALLQYLCEKESASYGDVLLITHAAFLRCLLNTSLGRNRNTPIDVSNGCIHMIGYDTFKNARGTIKRKDRKSVYKYETYEKAYVIKTYYKPSPSVMKIYNCLGAHPDKILYVKQYDGLLIVVSHYYSGLNVHGAIKVQDLYDAWANVIAVQRIIVKGCSSSDFKSVEDKIRECVFNAGNDVIDQIGRIYLAFCGALSHVKSTPVFYDLHRDNFSCFAGKWQLIDYDGVVSAPAEYQLAAFVASFLLIEEDSFVQYSKSIEKLCMLSNFDIQLVFNFVNIRLFTGLCYFYKKRWEDSNQYRRYLCSAIRWINYLQALDGMSPMNGLEIILALLLTLEKTDECME